MNSAAEKPFRKILLRALVDKNLTAGAVEKLKQHYPSPPDLYEAMERMKMFVTAAGTIRMVDVLNHVEAFAELLCGLAGL